VIDRATVEVYERSAVAYAGARRADAAGRAEDFASRLPPGGVRVDLGCGPGHYLPHLARGGPVVAVDAAPAMVAEARRRHPGTPGLVCDLAALPVRRGALAGVWTNKVLQHVPRASLPLALAGLHRALAVGGVLDLTVFAGDGDERSGEDDDFPGRHFTWWRPQPLTDLLVGAGFLVDEAPADPGGGRHARLTARATRARTLPDTVGPGMRLLLCGLNPSLYAADAGIGFARPGNRFWPAALTAGLVTRDRDPDHALRAHGVGMTDLVKRATPSASALTTAEYAAGIARVERLCAWLRPGVVGMVGLAGWRAVRDRRAAAGPQRGSLGGRPVYLMPNPSGLNAHTTVADLAAHLAAAASLGRGLRRSARAPTSTADGGRPVRTRSRTRADGAPGG
jgi:double-stranded uracil-DNA glycosylase